MLVMLASLRKRFPWLDRCLRTIETYTSLLDQWGVWLYLKPISAALVGGAVVVWTYLAQSWVPLAIVGGMMAFVSIALLPLAVKHLRERYSYDDKNISCVSCSLGISKNWGAGRIWQLTIYNDGARDRFRANIDLSSLPSGWSNVSEPEVTALWGGAAGKYNESYIDRFGRDNIFIYSSNILNNECSSGIKYWNPAINGADGILSQPHKINDLMSGSVPSIRIVVTIFTDSINKPKKVCLGADGLSMYIIASEVPLRHAN